MNIEAQLKDLIGPIPEGISEGVALGTGLADGYDVYESPIGDVAVTFNPTGVTSVDLSEPGFEDRFRSRFERPLIRAEAPRAWERHIRPAIEAGRPGKLPVDLSSVTRFQGEVLMATATIPRGEVRPYAWIASQAHHPKAIRAAGSSVASNPIPLIIPCHRVVRSDGHVGKYSLGGPENKWELLEHEGVNPNRLERLAAQHIRVFADPSNGEFCYPTCHAIQDIPVDALVPYATIAGAEADGYRPCNDCQPCC